MSNQPLNPTAMFNQAIKRSDPDGAWGWAKRIPGGLSLGRALELTVLLGVRDDPRYQRAAERFRERYEAEASPTPQALADLEDKLGKLGRSGPPPLRYGAGEYLRELAVRLRL